MLKNTAGQTLAVFAYDATTGAPKTGDAANITAKVSINGAAPAALTDAAAAELSAVNAPGVYLFDVTQAETNANLLVFSAASVTANVRLDPVVVYTRVDLEPQLDVIEGDVNSVGVDVGSIGTFLSDVFAGMTCLPKWLRAMLRKDAADAVALAEINSGGGTYAVASDSQEAGADAVAAITVGTTALVTTGVLQAAGFANATLAAGEPATDGKFVGQWIYVPSTKESRAVTAYNGTTKLATVDRAWVQVPAAGAAYYVFGQPTPALNSSLQVLAQSSAPITQSTAGNVSNATNFTAYANYRWEASVTFAIPSYGPPAGYDGYVLTIKESREDASDDAALIAIKVGVGLIRLNGAAAGDAALASLVVTGPIDGKLTAKWSIEASAMVLDPSPDNAPYALEVTGYVTSAPNHKDPLAAGLLKLVQSVRRSIPFP